MDMLAAYQEVGSYRGAAVMCGTSIRRSAGWWGVITLAAGYPERRDRGSNHDKVRDLITERVRKSQGRISAKWLLPAERVAAGYGGSARSFHRLVAEVEAALASGSSLGPPPGGVDAGRHAGDRLGQSGPTNSPTRPRHWSARVFRSTRISVEVPFVMALDVCVCWLPRWLPRRAGSGLGRMRPHHMARDPTCQSAPFTHAIGNG
jgi:hypothetical protein